MQDFFHQQYVYSFWGPHDAPLWVEEALCQAWCWLILFQYLTVKQETKINAWEEWNMIFAQVLRWMSDFLAGSFNKNTFWGDANPWSLQGGKAHYRHTLHMSKKKQTSIQNCRVFEFSAGEASDFAMSRFRLVGGDELWRSEQGEEAKMRWKPPFGVSSLYKSSAPKEETLLRFLRHWENSWTYERYC